MNANDMTVALLDIRGLLLNLYHSDKDSDPVLGDDGKKYNTASFGIDRFIKFVLIPLIEEDEIYPRKILAFWEGGNSRRRDLFPEYKSKSGKPEKDPVADAEEKKMFTMAKSLLASIGATSIMADNCEADDVIALFCEKLPCPMYVRTIDQDLLALDSDNVLVYLKDVPISEEHKGVPLSLISLEKSIVGDTSDNYKGIPGMGAKAFLKLLNEFGLDGMQELEACVKTGDYTLIEEALAEGSDSGLVKLYKNRAIWKEMYTLAALHPEWVGKPYKKKLCPIQFYKRIPNVERLRRVLEASNCMEHFEFLSELCPSSWLVDADNFDHVEDIKEAEKSFSETDIVAFDYESYDPTSQESLKKASGNPDFVDVLRQVPVGASFCWGKNHENCMYMTTGHANSANITNPWVGRMVEAIENAGARPVAHNASFEIELTERSCEFSPEKVYDTVIMSAYVDENMRAGLKSLSKSLFNYDQQTYEETLGDKDNMSELTAEDAAFPYGCDDAIVTAHLHDLLQLRMWVEGTWAFYEENQPDAERVLIKSKRDGVPLDEKSLDAYRQECILEHKECLGKFYALLQENCKSANPSNVKAFLAEDYIPTLKAKNKALDPEKRKSAEEIKEIISAQQVKLLEKCIYSPGTVETVYKSDSWVPTVNGIAKVTNKLNLPEFTSLAVSKISDYLESCYTTGYSNPKDLEFLGLLGPASSVLKKRSGKDYEAFKAFCIKCLRTEEDSSQVLSGFHLNTGSQPIMQQVLYLMMRLPVRIKSLPKFGTTRHKLGLEGSPGTDVTAIDTATVYDIPEGDWRHEALSLLKRISKCVTYESLYFSKYPDWIYTSDGMLHPTIRNCGTVTRRPSGGTPNLLQTSGGKDEGMLRSCFLPQMPGWKARGEEPMVVIAIDWSQQELRILASESRDETMMQCYIGETKKDIHSQSAVGILRKTHKMTDLTYDEFESRLQSEDPLCIKTRKAKAKPTNFCIGYGGVAFNLETRLIIPKKESLEIFDGVMETYPGISIWQGRGLKFAQKNGYTETAFGNRRHAQQYLFSKDKARVRRAGRQMNNAIIQGCAADILISVLAECHRTRVFEETDSKLIAPVYDELVSRVPVRTAVEYVQRITKLMSITPPGHDVPMEADVSIGPNWGTQYEIGIEPDEANITEACDKALKYIYKQGKI